MTVDPSNTRFTMNHPNPKGDLRAIEEPEKRERPELLEARTALQFDQQFDEAITQANEFLGLGDEELAAEAARLAALGMFRKGAYDEALPLFERRAQFSQQSADWYNAAAAATLSGAIDRGAQYFSKAVECHREVVDAQTPSLEYLRLMFASLLRDCQQYESSLDQIEKLQTAYERPGHASDKSLLNPLTPPLSQTLDLAADVLESLKDSVDAESWMKTFAERLSGENRRAVTEACNRLR